MEKVRQNIYLPVTLKQKIDKLAESEHRSFSQQVVRMIESSFANRGENE